MNKVILITGSGSGIGQTIAVKFAKAGNPVIVNDINEAAGESIVTQIREAGGKGFFVKADVSDPEQVKEMFDTAKKAFGEVEVLVNNAGTPGRFSLISDMPDKTWHNTISVHLSGSFYCMREAARRMMPNGFGRIINISSIAGLSGTVGSAEYGAAKAGMINLAMTASKELGSYNITVNAIAPGMVGTHINKELHKRNNPFISRALESVSTGEMTLPEDIAELVFFLSGNAAKNINGEVIRMDGGALVNMSIDSFMLDFLGQKSPGAEKGL